MDSVSVTATREIMWGIPHSFKVLMYVLLFVSLGLFAKGVYDKLKFVVGKNKGISYVQGGT